MLSSPSVGLIFNPECAAKLVYTPAVHFQSRETSSWSIEISTIHFTFFMPPGRFEGTLNDKPVIKTFVVVLAGTLVSHIPLMNFVVADDVGSNLMCPSGTFRLYSWLLTVKVILLLVIVKL